MQTVCGDMALAVKVSVTENAHYRSCVHSQSLAKPFQSCTIQRQAFSLPQVCAHMQSLTGKKGVQDVGVGDMSSWRSLAHQQHNFSLCKKSVQVCFRRNNRTLYKISRHFFLLSVSGSNGHISPTSPYAHYSVSSLLPSLVVHRSEWVSGANGLFLYS